MASGPGPHRNRVDPFGEVVAIALRGAWTGNRGILHRAGPGADHARPEIVRHHTGIAWITCVLAFRRRRIPQWAPGHYTPLFFHDEAVALAAGHRPCAECRRPAFRAFVDALGGLRAPELDRRLHTERWRPRRGRRVHPLPWADLPDGAFVVADGTPALVIGDALVGWTSAGYCGATSRPTTGTATVLTPPATLTVLRAGYPVQIDSAAPAAAQARSSTAGSTSSTEA